MRFSATRQRGQALTELAIASVLLILIVFGVLDFARLYNSNTAMVAAAREGARYAIAFDGATNTNPNLTTASIKSTVDTVLQGAGLPATSSATGGCLGSSSSHYNPPFADSAYPAGTLDPIVIICYNTATGATAPAACGTTCGGYDMEVAVLMRYPFLITGPVGPNAELTAVAHMRVQGS